MPWHNEWVNIIIYLVFAIYFWIELIMIMCENKNYDFANVEDFYFMFVGTIGICLSLTATVVYLTFYSMNEKS